jgi:hypothetical protein
MENVITNTVSIAVGSLVNQFALTWSDVFSIVAMIIGVSVVWGFLHVALGKK